MTKSPYVYEKEDQFYVTYNASMGLLSLILALIFSAVLFWLSNTVFPSDIRLPFSIFFGLLLLISIASIPYSISNIKKNNRGLIWGGDNSGLYLGGEMTDRFFYEWQQISKIILIDKLKYARNHDDPDERYLEHNIVLFEVDAVKNPITGKPSRFLSIGSFDKKKNGARVLKLSYPKGEKEPLIKILKKYSNDALEIVNIKNFQYAFGL